MGGRMTREELIAALADLGEAADLVSQKLSIIQPFWSVWRKHGAVIEECRRIAALKAMPQEDGK